MSRRRTRTAGQAMIEFALVLPLFFALMFATIDLGRAIFIQNELNNAAADAARYALAHPTSTCTSGTACSTNQAAAAAATYAGTGLTICSASFYSASILSSGSPPSCPNSATTSQTYGYVTVQLTVPFAPFAGFFGTDWNISLTSQSTMLFQP